MRALRGLVARSNPLENPATPLTGDVMLSAASAGELWGAPTDANPLRIGAAFRCAQIIASAVAGCPIRGIDRETRAEAPIEGLPGDESVVTRYNLIETQVLHLVLRGNSFGRTHRGRGYQVEETEMVDPSLVDVEVVRTPQGRRRTRYRVGTKVLSPLEISHVAGLSYDGVRGLSVIGNMRRTYELAAASERAASTLFDRGLVAPVALTTEQDLGPDKARQMEDRIQARLSGTDGVGRVAVFGSGVKPTPLSMSLADAQFLEQRKFSVTDIARLHGIPGWMINDQEKSTSWGSGMEQQFTSFVVLTLKPYMQRIEQKLARDYVDGRRYKVEFDVNGLLRGDSKARAAFYSSGITNGWMVPNEARELEDMPPVEWGNKPYLPHNGGTTDQAGDDSGDDA